MIMMTPHAGFAHLFSATLLLFQPRLETRVMLQKKKDFVHNCASLSDMRVMAPQITGNSTICSSYNFSG